MKIMNIDLEKLKSETWIKNWAGGWSVLTCSYLGKQYSKNISDYLGINLKRSIIVIKKGFSTCYFSKQELDKLGKELSARVIEDEGLIDTWVGDIKKVTDEINGVMDELKGKFLSKDEYAVFVNKFIDFGARNFAIKKIVDYLPKNILEKNLAKLSDARLYSEIVYTNTEKFMEAFAEKIGIKDGCESKFVLCLLDREFENYLKSGKINISKDILKNRFNFSTLFFNNGKDTILNNEDAKKVERAMIKESLKELSGKIAFHGKSTGVARVILDPRNVKKFDKGDILVTSMTRPEYLQLIQKSSAFITDAGGMLCHAAITAREIEKPCIVGLEVATRSIKDGDIIEVDADRGVVRIIK